MGKEKLSRYRDNWYIYTFDAEGNLLFVGKPTGYAHTTYSMTKLASRAHRFADQIDARASIKWFLDGYFTIDSTYRKTVKVTELDIAYRDPDTGVFYDMTTGEPLIDEELAESVRTARRIAEAAGYEVTINEGKLGRAVGMAALGLLGLFKTTVSAEPLDTIIDRTSTELSSSDAPSVITSGSHGPIYIADDGDFIKYSEDGSRVEVYYENGEEKATIDRSADGVEFRSNDIDALKILGIYDNIPKKFRNNPAAVRSVRVDGDVDGGTFKITISGTSESVVINYENGTLADYSIAGADGKSTYRYKDGKLYSAM